MCSHIKVESIIKQICSIMIVLKEKRNVGNTGLFEMVLKYTTWFSNQTYTCGILKLKKRFDSFYTS